MLEVFRIDAPPAPSPLYPPNRCPLPPSGYNRGPDYLDLPPKLIWTVTVEDGKSSTPGYLIHDYLREIQKDIMGCTSGITNPPCWILRLRSQDAANKAVTILSGTSVSNVKI